MSEISRVALFGKLSQHLYKAIESATVSCKMRGNPYVELVHWFHQLLQSQESDLHRIIKSYEIDLSKLGKDMVETLDLLPKGSTTIVDLSSDVEEAVERGWIYATLMFADLKIRSGYLLIGILKTKSLSNRLFNISTEFERIKVDSLADRFAQITEGSPEIDSKSHDDVFRVGSINNNNNDAVGPRIFIAYRRKDSRHFVGRIYDRLTRRFGTENVFRDLDSLPLGKHYREIIFPEITKVSVVLVIIGESWINNGNSKSETHIDQVEDVLRMEIEAGLSLKKSVIPVLIDGVSIQDVRLPSSIEALRGRQALPIPEEYFDEAVDRLSRAIENAFHDLGSENNDQG